MNRRSSPAAKRDDDAFPIRLKFAVPREGLGKLLDEVHAWLRSSLPPQTFAIHSGRSIGGSAMAVYFLALEDAARFHEAFGGRLRLALPPRL